MTISVSLKLSTLTFILVLSVVVAITQQRECYKWEYPCPNNDGCCNCLMCPGGSACTHPNEMEKACMINIPQSFYPSCDNIAHCGWGEQEATFPTCPPIPPQDDARVTYITPPTSFRYKKVENHLFAEARIVCADGTNSTVVECLPGGTDGSGGRWNGSTSLICNKDYGADVVSTPPNQMISSTPSKVVSSDDLPTTPSVTAAENNTLHVATISYEVQDNTSGKNITILEPDKTAPPNVTSAKKSEFPVFAIALIGGVGGSVVLGSAGLLIYWFCFRNRGNDNQRDPEDGGPRQDDALLKDDADITRNGTRTDHDVSRANPHASENGHCVQKSGSLQANGDVATHQPPVENGHCVPDRDTPHANGAPHLQLVEAAYRGPTESSVDSLEMQTRGDSSTLRGNLDQEGGCDPKTSMGKKMPSNNIELGHRCSCPVSLGSLPLRPQQARRDPVEDDIGSADSVTHSCHCHVAVVNPLSQPEAKRPPEEQDDRNILGSESSSTGGSDSDNQASTSQTSIKEMYDYSGQDQGVGEVNGSDEGLPSIEDLSKADPVDRRDDGRSHYTGTGTPEEVNTAVPEEAVDSQVNPLDFSTSGVVPDPTPDSVGPQNAETEEEEVLHGASGGPSCEHNDLAGRNNGPYSNGNLNRAEEANHPYCGDLEGEQRCKLTLRKASEHPNFQEFALTVKKYTDRAEEPWRLLAEKVCEEYDPAELEHQRYMIPLSQDSKGIGGHFFYKYATNSGRHQKLYRLVHFIRYCPGVELRYRFLKLVESFFPEHADPDNTESFCAACKEIFQSLPPPDDLNNS